MASSGASDALLGTARSRWLASLAARIRAAVERLLVPAGAIALSVGIFGVFIALIGTDPFSVFFTIYDGAFGSWFSWQNTFERAAPLLLTALCTALPARLGLIVIGGEGGYVIGAIAAVVTAVAIGDASRPLVIMSMMVIAMFAAGLWVAAAGALREYRGVNETISSLLLNYIAIAIMNFLVSGPIRDATVVHRPSSWSIGEQNMLGTLPEMDVHWGLGFGLIACLFTYVLMQHTRFGFAGRIVGGNERAARIVGLPVRLLAVIACFVGGQRLDLRGWPRWPRAKDASIAQSLPDTATLGFWLLSSPAIIRWPSYL